MQTDRQAELNGNYGTVVNMPERDTWNSHKLDNLHLGNWQYTVEET
jgi:hypothetical protein